ncbi:hypothetical protein DFH05DRAFT_1518887 [Lentinula detonsa]|uniref:Myb/SANT-like domain-containing protein n=1 Tax=Lentinula detonsa TaxID=2804962 RepID=A0A9W8U3A6_9AGAR|nr:hypothetical protein DFH05DRAFT_1518887 [Lentinula detonsa]
MTDSEDTSQAAGMSGDESKSISTAPTTSNSQGKRANSNNAKWTQKDDQAFVKGLIHARKLGMQTDSGWKASTWPIVLEFVQKEGSNIGGPKNTKKALDYFGKLKTSFNQVTELRALSGVGWDDVRKIVTATNSVWDAIFLKRDIKRFGRWRKTPFPIYDEMAELIEGVVANGENAFIGGASQTPYEDRSGNSSGNETEPDPVPTKKRKRATSEKSIPPLLSHSSSSSVTLGQSSIHSKRIHTRDRGTPNAKAMHRVADSIDSLGLSLRGDVSTPERRRQAVKQFEADGEISDDEADSVYDLFKHDTSAIDIYLGIGTKERHSRFLR